MDFASSSANPRSAEVRPRPFEFYRLPLEVQVRLLRYLDVNTQYELLAVGGSEFLQRLAVKCLELLYSWK